MHAHASHDSNDASVLNLVLEYELHVMLHVLQYCILELSRKSCREQKIIEKKSIFGDRESYFISVLLNFEFLIKVFLM